MYIVYLLDSLFGVALELLRLLKITKTVTFLLRMS